MTWNQTHPRWTAACIPSDIPQGFADHSYRHDAMPCFWDEKQRLMLWIDHSDPAERETGSTDRFCLVRTVDGDDTDCDWENGIVITSSDWNAIKAAIAADRMG